MLKLTSINPSTFVQPERLYNVEPEFDRGRLEGLLVLATDDNSYFILPQEMLKKRASRNS
ncbi:MAG: hypothetical protein M3463_14335 [Verrucomicrobiota bacterium]|nr:hypothetical protein [Verrucomicrobiota bacterium]